MARFAGGTILILLMLMLTHQWITLANLGGFAVRVPYPVLMVAVICVAVMAPLRGSTLRMIAGSALWLGPFTLYLLAILPAFHDSIAQGSPIRQIVFVMGTVSVASCLMALSDPRPVLRAGGVLSLLSFMITTELVGRTVDVNWTEAISRFLAGDLDFVIYSFLRNIFNAFGDTSSDRMMLASEKNAISASIFLALVLFRMAGPRFRADWAGVIVTVLTICLLLMLNTRSVLLPLILALLMAGVLPLFRPPASSDPTRFLLGMTLAVLVIGLSLPLLAANDGPLMEMLRGRFALTDESSSSRLTQLGFAMHHIEGSILTGNGYMQVDAHPVHNLFLASFLHGGILPFLLTVTFYLVVLVGWLRFVFQLAVAPQRWRLDLRPEWVAALPLLPLIRVWLTGDAGHPSLPEWLALTFFQALCLMNAAQGRRAFRAARAGGGEAAAPAPSTPAPPAAGSPGAAAAPA